MTKQKSSKKPIAKDDVYTSLYNGKETETQLVHTPLVGDKVVTDETCLDPYEVILCDQCENPFDLKEDGE